MATSLIIEEECGTSRGVLHSHNGYYAGDFSNHQATIVNQVVTPDPQCDPAADSAPQFRGAFRV